MDILQKITNLDWLRKEIIGRNLLFTTPFGKKPLIYSDYTASGRGIKFIEHYLDYITQFYANTHTDDSFTGKTMTNLLHTAENNIKHLVNAGSTGKIVFTGTGATGAITRLQNILGVFISPAAKNRIKTELQEAIINNPTNFPIIFVGPYEHHSNEIMWRQGICDVIEIPLNNKGELDLNILEKELSNSKYKNRPKIGSFSAASNVSGIKTPIYKVATILHKHNAFACFDFAACAPYVEINMNRDKNSYFDAIVLSPHKFLGGPSTSGLLIFNERIYQTKLPPSIAAGGTVTYVTSEEESFVDDIEEREKPGTPGILQAIKTSLVFQLKEKIGIQTIDAIEKHYFNLFHERIKNLPNIIIYGTTDPNKKVNIISFNIKHKDRILHPKFFTKLINDLFGIQTRAGCSCAGPYGHQLLGIDNEESRRFTCLIDNRGAEGIKPGWVRLNLHYSFSQDEFDYIMEALEFSSIHAHRFLPLYSFNMKSGEWIYNRELKDNINISYDLHLDIDTIIKNSDDNFFCDQENVNHIDLNQEFIKNRDYALSVVDKLKELPFLTFDDDLEEVMFFYTTQLVSSENT